MIITKTALSFRPTVYLLLLLIILAGGDSYRSMPLEASPDVQIPIILVSTIYPGVAPVDMETLVTNPMERQLKELKDVKEMRSTSAESASIVEIEFESGVDMDDAYQKVRDKVDQAKPDLPVDAEDPTLMEINISEFPIMLVNIFGGHDLVGLKAIAERLEDQFETIPGVLDVEITGGLEREVQVILDPERLEFYGIGAGMVIGRIQEEHLNVPGGNLQLGGSKYLVRVTGEYKRIQLMEDIVLKYAGAPIKLKDVGKVVDTFADRETISRVNGEECVTLRIQKRSGENVVFIADEIRKVLSEVEPTLPKGVKFLIQQDHSKYIRDMVSDLENSVISGLVLVLAVLFFFMGIRNAFFVAIAIPTSLLMTMGILHAMGITLNMVVLFSLILALGMLVDNSIVVVEAIYQKVCMGMPRLKAAYEGTSEVAWPVLTSTLTTVAAFAPMIFWPGIMGDFMSYLPITVIVSLSASLFVALVINPVIAAGFIKVGKPLFGEDGQAKGWLLVSYQRVLAFCIRHPYAIMTVGILSFAGVIAAFAQAGTGVEFFPESTPERAQITIKAPIGTRIEGTNELALKVEALAKLEDNLKNAVSNVGFGGGEVSVGSGGSSSHKAVVDLELKDRFERSHSTWDTITHLRETLAELSGGEHRLQLEENGPPTGSPVDVQISGEDFERLKAYATQIKAELATIPGVVDIKDDNDSGFPEVHIDIDRELAKARKLSTATIGNMVRLAVNGTKAAVLREGEEETDIVVRFGVQDRDSLDDLRQMRIGGEDDVQIPLSDVAKVETAGGFGSVRHIDRKRTIRITADVQGRSSSEVLVEVQALLKEKVGLDPGYQLHYGGESEEQDAAAEFLSRAFIIAIMLIAMILIAQFNSVAKPIIIMTSVLMSLQGVFLGLMITGNKFGIIMTGMGVISLAGVVVNNAIVLIDYINQLRRDGLELAAAVLRAGVVRFRPVMMTAVTTVLGMLPMALGINIDFKNLSWDSGGGSAEMWGPMAQAVAFGLAFATLMTLIMVPVMYVLQERMASGIGGFFRRITGGTKAPVSEEAQV